MILFFCLLVASREKSLTHLLERLDFGYAVLDFFELVALDFHFEVLKAGLETIVDQPVGFREYLDLLKYFQELCYFRTLVCKNLPY